MTHCECPICLDIIDGIKNCVTTECGHAFHTNCLMTSVAHNGFGCPYCRTAMAEAPEEEDEDEEEEEEEEDEMFSDYALLGFRMFHSNVIGEALNLDDLEEEDEFEAELEEVEEDENEAVPSSDFITQKLVEQGFTMEHLVKSILGGCHEEYQNHDEYNRVDDDLFGKMRIIISNYSPEQNESNVQTVVAEPQADDSAQPKTSIRPSILSRIMMHV